MMKRIGLMIALFALVAFPVPAWAQQGATAPAAPAAAETGADHGQHHGHGHQHDHDMHKGHDGGHGEGHSGGHRGMMRKCMEMKEKSDKAMEDIQAMDGRIDEKMAALKNAKGDQKMAAMEAVLGELVSQRKEMREKLGDMHHHQAMCGMMARGGHHGRMRHGEMKGKCPMMGGTEHHTEHRSGEGDGAKSEAVN
mgnify:CR=1 FL=1